MQNSDDRIPKDEGGGKLWLVAAPLIFCGMYLLVGLFFRRPDMGDPDSYREAISAIRYIKDGAYFSYWDHPLTMHFFVAGSRIAFAFGWNQLATLNTLAVLLAATTAWPIFHIIRKLVNLPTAAFASAAYVLSPALIRFTTYLTHDGLGFVFAVWSIYLFGRALETGRRNWAFAFGLAFGATCAARPNAAVFIVLPLLTLLVKDRDRHEADVLRRLLLFSLLGFLGCLLPIFRPEILSRLVTRSDKVLSAHYELFWYSKSTTGIAIASLTPALVALAAAGAVALVALGKRFVALFAGIWILPVYLFYMGILCRHRYFLILLPPCILLVLAGADRIDDRLGRWRGRSPHIAKIAVTLLLILASLGPTLPELRYVRQSNDDELVATGIGRIVGRELLFTTSLRPMINYYNLDNPPETVYLITELKPGTLKMDAGALRRAQLHLRQGRPVFATRIIIAHFEHLKIDFDAESVWEYKSQELFRITRLNLSGMAVFDQGGA